MKESFFSQFKNIYLVGIKGAGMTALAEILQDAQVQVRGSDTEEKFYTDEILRKRNIPFRKGFSKENITKDIDLVIHSTAYKASDHPELLAASEQGIQILSYPEAVGKLTEEKLTLAVCGTHGKTTTSSLLADVLQSLDEQPSALIGSKITSWGGSALTGSGRFFVLEADEYQNKLAKYTPFGVILTSVDYDHPDFFPTTESYLDTFKAFVSRIPLHGILIYNGDDANVAAIAQSARCKTLSYGFLQGNDFQITNYAPIPRTGIGQSGVLQTFTVIKNEESLGVFELSLAGKHNASNATAVIALVNHLGLSVENAKKALSSFSGTARRFEYIGERFGALLYDDYAHHPEELRVTLKAFRELYPEKRITGIFHPHTFTRTKALFQEFAQSFEAVDRICVLPIYGSAREEQGGVSSEELVDAVNGYAPGKAVFFANHQEAQEILEKEIGKNDIIISLGAGDVWQVTHALAKKI